MRLPFGVRVVFHVVRVTSRAARASRAERPDLVVLDGGADPTDPPEPLAMLVREGRVH